MPKHKVEAWGFREDGETWVQGSYTRIDTADTDAGIDRVTSRLMDADDNVRQVHYYIDGEHAGVQALLTWR